MATPVPITAMDLSLSTEWSQRQSGRLISLMRRARKYTRGCSLDPKQVRWIIWPSLSVDGLQDTLSYFYFIAETMQIRWGLEPRAGAGTCQNPDWGLKVQSLSLLLKYFIYLFYLCVCIRSCLGTGDLLLHHARSFISGLGLSSSGVRAQLPFTSPTRNQTMEPLQWKHKVLTTGPPSNSPSSGSDILQQNSVRDKVIVVRIGFIQKDTHFIDRTQPYLKRQDRP